MDNSETSQSIDRDSHRACAVRTVRKLMGLILLLVAPVLLTPANAASGCQKQASKIIRSHNAELAKIDAASAAKREKLIAKYLKTLSDENKIKEFKEITSKIIDRNLPPKLSTRASKALLANLQIVAETEGRHEACDEINDYKGYASQTEANYEFGLDELHAELEDRIDIESLSPNSGLAVIAAYSDGYAGRVFINRRRSLTGTIHIGPMNDSQYFRVIELPSGEYNWGKVSLSEKGSTQRHYDFSDLDLNFRIEAGKLNYIGVFTFARESMNRASARINDRAAIVMDILERIYPELLDQHEIANGLVADDAFINFYLDEKRQALQ